MTSMPALSNADAALLSRDLPELKVAEVASALYAGGRGRLEYRVTGAEDRPVLVLLHGLGSSSAGYRAQLAGLGDDFRVIAWNAPGFGNSTPMAAPDPDVQDYVGILGAFLAALKIRRIAVMVGSSWGSIIAVALAAARPEVVENLMLSSANTGRGELSGAERETEMAARLKAADTSIAVARSTIADRLLTPQTPSEVRRHVEALRDAMTTVGWKQAVKMLFSVHTPDLIRDVKCPIVMIAGTLDQIAPHRVHAERLCAAARSAELDLFEGYGHMLKLEAPTRFNEIVRIMALKPPSPDPRS
jgi:pimeloyl-ACP methyl ester carboxylesterase